MADVAPEPSIRPDRSATRGWPRLTITLAGAGCGLIVLGVVAFGAADLGEGGLNGGTAQLPGLVLSLAVTIAGFVMVARGPSAPMRTAGVVASALGVPATLLFLTYDEASLPPFSIDVVLIGSTVTWAVSYAAGPGKGRLFYLGAALVGAWLTLLELVESVFSFPFAAVGGFFDGVLGFDSDIGATPSTLLPPFTVPGSPSLTIPDIPPNLLPGSPLNPLTPLTRLTHVPDPSSIGMLSLLFGIGYLVSARVLDRRGQAGRATPFAFAGILTLAAGIAFLAVDIEASGAGLLFVIAGILVAAHGAAAARRGTTWAGGAGVFVGVFLIAGDTGGDSARTFGVIAIVFGAGVIALAHILARSTAEPADDEPGPSFGGLQPSGDSVQRPLPVDGGGDGLG